MDETHSNESVGEISSMRKKSTHPSSKAHISLPRLKKIKRDLLTDLPLESHESQQEILSVMRKSFHWPSLSMSTHEFRQVQSVNNPDLTSKYLEKRREWKSTGYPDSLLVDTYAFLPVENPSIVEKICRNGVRCGNQPFSGLGVSQMAVHLNKHADVLAPSKQVLGDKICILVKLLKGKVKTVVCKNVGVQLEPTPNYDCHIAKSGVEQTSSMPYHLLFYSMQLYVYEYGDLGVEDYPKQILPYAVIHYTLKDTTPVIPKHIPSVPRGVFKPEQQTAFPPTSVSAVAKAPLLGPKNEVWRGKLHVPLIDGGKLNIEVSIFSNFVPLTVSLLSPLKIYRLFPESSAQITFFAGLTDIADKPEVPWREHFFRSFVMRPRSNSEEHFKALIKHISEKREMPCVRLPSDVYLFMMPKCLLSSQLGLVHREDNSPVLYCVLMSKYSTLKAEKKKMKQRMGNAVLHHHGKARSWPELFDDSDNETEEDINPPGQKVDQALMGSLFHQQKSIQNRLAAMSLNDVAANISPCDCRLSGEPAVYQRFRRASDIIRLVSGIQASLQNHRPNPKPTVSHFPSGSRTKPNQRVSRRSRAMPSFSPHGSSSSDSDSDSKENGGLPGGRRHYSVLNSHKTVEEELSEEELTAEQMDDIIFMRKPAATAKAKSSSVVSSVKDKSKRTSVDKTGSEKASPLLSEPKLIPTEPVAQRLEEIASPSRDNDSPEPTVSLVPKIIPTDSVLDSSALPASTSQSRLLPISSHSITVSQPKPLPANTAMPKSILKNKRSLESLTASSVNSTTSSVPNNLKKSKTLNSTTESTPLSPSVPVSKSTSESDSAVIKTSATSAIKVNDTPLYKSSNSELSTTVTNASVTNLTSLDVPPAPSPPVPMDIDMGDVDMRIPAPHMQINTLIPPISVTSSSSAHPLSPSLALGSWLAPGDLPPSKGFSAPPSTSSTTTYNSSSSTISLSSQSPFKPSAPIEEQFDIDVSIASPPSTSPPSPSPFDSPMSPPKSPVIELESPASPPMSNCYNELRSSPIAIPTVRVKHSLLTAFSSTCSPISPSKIGGHDKGNHLSKQLENADDMKEFLNSATEFDSEAESPNEDESFRAERNMAKEVENAEDMNDFLNSATTFEYESPYEDDSLIDLIKFGKQALANKTDRFASHKNFWLNCVHSTTERKCLSSRLEWNFDWQMSKGVGTRNVPANMDMIFYKQVIHCQRKWTNPYKQDLVDLCYDDQNSHYKMNIPWFKYSPSFPTSKLIKNSILDYPDTEIFNDLINPDYNQFVCPTFLSITVFPFTIDWSSSSLTSAATSTSSAQINSNNFLMPENQQNDGGAGSSSDSLTSLSNPNAPRPKPNKSIPPNPNTATKTSNSIPSLVTHRVKMEADGTILPLASVPVSSSVIQITPVETTVPVSVNNTTNSTKSVASLQSLKTSTRKVQSPKTKVHPYLTTKTDLQKVMENDQTIRPSPPRMVKHTSKVRKFFSTSNTASSSSSSTSSTTQTTQSKLKLKMKSTVSKLVGSVKSLADKMTKPYQNRSTQSTANESQSQTALKVQRNVSSVQAQDRKQTGCVSDANVGNKKTISTPLSHLECQGKVRDISNIPKASENSSPQTQTLPVRGKDSGQVANSRKIRRAHPYNRPGEKPKTEKSASEAPKCDKSTKLTYATFNLAYRDLQDLMQCLTSSSFSGTKSRKQKWRRGRFTNYHFVRSKVGEVEKEINTAKCSVGTGSKSKHSDPSRLLKAEDLEDFEERARMADKMEELLENSMSEGLNDNLHLLHPDTLREQKGPMTASANDDNHHVTAIKDSTSEHNKAVDSPTNSSPFNCQQSAVVEVISEERTGQTSLMESMSKVMRTPESIAEVMDGGHEGDKTQETFDESESFIVLSTTGFDSTLDITFTNVDEMEGSKPTNKSQALETNEAKKVLGRETDKRENERVCNSTNKVKLSLPEEVLVELGNVTGDRIETHGQHQLTYKEMERTAKCSLTNKRIDNDTSGEKEKSFLNVSETNCEKKVGKDMPEMFVGGRAGPGEYNGSGKDEGNGGFDFHPQDDFIKVDEKKEQHDCNDADILCLSGQHDRGVKGCDLVVEGLQQDEILEMEDKDIDELKDEDGDILELQDENADILKLQDEDGDILELQDEDGDILELQDENSDIIELQDEDSDIIELQEEDGDTLELQDENADITELQDEDSDIIELQEEDGDTLELQDENADITELQDEDSDIIELQDEENDIMKLQDEDSDIIELQEEDGDITELQDEDSDTLELQDEDNDITELQDEDSDIIELQDEENDIMKLQDEDDDIIELQDEDNDITKLQDEDDDIIELRNEDDDIHKMFETKEANGLCEAGRLNVTKSEEDLLMRLSEEEGGGELLEELLEKGEAVCAEDSDNNNRDVEVSNNDRDDESGTGDDRSIEKILAKLDGEDQTEGSAKLQVRSHIRAVRREDDDFRSGYGIEVRQEQSNIDGELSYRINEIKDLNVEDGENGLFVRNKKQNRETNKVNLLRYQKENAEIKENNILFMSERENRYNQPLKNEKRTIENNKDNPVAMNETETVESNKHSLLVMNESEIVESDKGDSYLMNKKETVRNDKVDLFVVNKKEARIAESNSDHHLETREDESNKQKDVHSLVLGEDKSKMKQSEMSCHGVKIKIENKNQQECCEEAVDFNDQNNIEKFLDFKMIQDGQNVEGKESKIKAYKTGESVSHQSKKRPEPSDLSDGFVQKKQKLNDY